MDSVLGHVRQMVERLDPEHNVFTDKVIETLLNNIGDIVDTLEDEIVVQSETSK